MKMTKNVIIGVIMKKKANGSGLTLSEGVIKHRDSESDKENSSKI